MTLIGNYFGCNIYRRLPSGYYCALTSDGTKTADTLTGIKELIKAAEKK